MLEGRDVSGRIDECYKQGEAWLVLGDQVSARRLLGQMLQMSFGVGYRKDDQLETWIEWLGLINAQEPKRAAERIAWFARAAVVLKETTEGDAARDAAHALLAVAFRWSPRRAISLSQWFLKQRVIGYVETISILLAEALKSSESPTALVRFSLVDFLLPVTTYADPELASLLIEKTAARHGTQRAIETARYFLFKVCVYALPSTRAKWRRGIARALQNIGIDLQRAGLTPTDLRPDQEEQKSSRSLKLKDTSTLSIEEVQARVSSILDLQELLHNQSDSYFDWQPIVAHMVNNMGVEDVYTLVALFEHDRYASQILAILSKKLSALGKLQGAWSLGEQALNASQAHGWLRRWDGGSRLAAFQALAQADPIRTRPLAYDKIIQDLTSKFWYPQNLALELDEILPLLTDEVRLQAVWPVVEQYVYTLFEGFSLSTDSPDLNEEPSHDSPSQAIADLLILHVDHPVYAVAQVSKRTCAKLLLQRDLAVQSAVHECLEKTESQQEHILMVLDAVSLYDPSAVAPFRNTILSLHQSPNYAIQRAAQMIGRRIGCEQTVAAPHPMPLLETHGLCRTQSL